MEGDAPLVRAKGPSRSGSPQAARTSFCEQASAYVGIAWDPRFLSWDPSHLVVQDGIGTVSFALCGRGNRTTLGAQSSCYIICNIAKCLVGGGDRAGRRGGLAGRGRHVRVGTGEVAVGVAVLLAAGRGQIRAVKGIVLSIDYDLLSVAVTVESALPLASAGLQGEGDGLGVNDRLDILVGHFERCGGLLTLGVWWFMIEQRRLSKFWSTVFVFLRSEDGEVSGRAKGMNGDREVLDYIGKFPSG